MGTTLGHIGAVVVQDPSLLPEDPPCLACSRLRFVRIKLSTVLVLLFPGLVQVVQPVARCWANIVCISSLRSNGGVLSGLRVLSADTEMFCS